MQQQHTQRYPLYQRPTTNQGGQQGIQQSKRDAAAMHPNMQHQGIRREPPPYPGPTRSFHNAGYRQSYASSETGSTDLSLSSCENLCTSMRQDPQGSEETASLLSNPMDPCRPLSAGGYNVMMPPQQQNPQSGVEVKSANSSTFYVTGNMPSQNDEVNMTSYTALPQMPPSPHYASTPPMYSNRQSLPPSAPGTPDPMSAAATQMGLYAQPPSAPSTPDHMHSQSPFLNTQQQQQHQQQQLYSNQYYNNNANLGSSSPMHHNSSSGAGGQMQHQAAAVMAQSSSQQQQLSQSLPKHKQQHPLVMQQTGDGSSYGNFPSAAGQPFSDSPVHNPGASSRNMNNQLNNQSLEESHQCKPQSQQAGYANPLQNVLQEQLLDSNSKNDPYKKWRHFYVNQKTQLSQYKVLNQLVEGQSPEEASGPNQGGHVSDNKENLNISPIKLAKSKSGSQIGSTGGGDGGKSYLDTCVSNVRATDRLRSATPDMMSDRPSVSRQLPMRPSSANAVAKQQRNANNQDLRQLSFLKQQQQQQHLLKASQKGGASSPKKPPTALTSSSSAKDDGMSTISTMSTTSNMSTSSSEVEHANMARAINRQRSASGGNQRHPNLNNAAKLNSGGGSPNSKLCPSASPKSMNYPSGSYLNYMHPETHHQHKQQHLQSSPKPGSSKKSQVSTSKSAASANVSSSKSSTPSAFKAALHKFTGKGSASRQSSSDGTGNEHVTCADDVNAQLSRNLTQSRSASRLPRPRTAPPQREKLQLETTRSSPNATKYNRDESRSRDDKGLQFHAFDMDSPVAENKLSSNKKEFSRSCEMLNQLLASQEAQRSHFQGHIDNSPQGHRLLSSFKGQGQKQQQPDSTQAGDENSSAPPPFLGSVTLQGQGDSEGHNYSSHFKKSSLSTSPQQQLSMTLEPGQDNRPRLPGNNTLNNGEVDHAAIATRATQMVERLSAENQSLRGDLEKYKAKVAKLLKFEEELQKVSEDYESLVKHTQNQEGLEKVMRFKLGCEIKKLKDQNAQLKGSHDGSSFTKTSDTDVKREMKEKDGMLTKLISQNRELSKTKDRVEIELTGEKVRNEERLKQVNALEKALTSTQSQVFKLEEEVGRLKIRETKIDQLQAALTQLRTATEKRELIEQKLRHKLEEEVRLLKHHKGIKGGGSKASDTDEGISSDSECPTRVHTLMRQMSEREQQILKLESQVAHWEQKFYEEGALRILAVDAASVPKDARIAALEMSSQDTERLIEESRADRLRNLEEVYKAKKSTAELEAKVKTLELQLAERDAMVRILNRPNTSVTSSSLSRTSSQNSLSSPTTPLGSPNTTAASSPPGAVTSPLAAKRPSPLAATSGSVSMKAGSGASNSGSVVTVSSPLTPQLPHRDVSKLIAHAKSNSEGAVLDLSSMATGLGSNSSQATVTKDAQQPKHDKLEPTLKELQKKLVAQAAIFQNWQQEEPGDIKKELYQV